MEHWLKYTVPAMIKHGPFNDGLSLSELCLHTGPQVARSCSQANLILGPDTQSMPQVEDQLSNSLDPYVPYQQFVPTNTLGLALNAADQQAACCLVPASKIAFLAASQRGLHTH